ncbi:hypothetical protein ILUMI_11306, partial [Ignelater luminosus]
MSNTLGNGLNQIHDGPGNEKGIESGIGVAKEKRARARVSIAIKKKYLKNIRNWSAISERIIKMELMLQGQDLAIVEVYAPTNDATTEVKDASFEKLEEAIDTFENRRNLILLSDFNG